MDDRYAHFIGVVGDICVAAELASLDVEILTGAGARSAGVPGAIREAADQSEEADDSGYARTFRIDDRLVRLDEIVECTIRVPADLDE